MNYSTLSDKDLYSKCVNLSLTIHRYRNQFIALLPEVNRRHLFKKHGMHSIYEFAAKLGCLSNKTVDRILNVSAKIEKLPKIKEKFETGEIGWTKLEVVAPILGFDNEIEFANKLPTLSINSARTLVKDIKANNFDIENLRKSKEMFSVKIAPELMSQLRVLKLQLEKESKIPLSWEQALGIIVSKLQKPVSVEKPFKQSNTRYIPKAQKQSILAKTHQLCAKCNKPAEHLHHQIPFSISKSHESIVPLCKAHHDLAHHNSDNYVNRKYQMYKLASNNLALLADP